MADINVNPTLVYQVYDQKLGAAHHENAILQAAVSQLQDELASANQEIDRLKSKGDLVKASPNEESTPSTWD
jgi:phage shock protein A